MAAPAPWLVAVHKRRQARPTQAGDGMTDPRQSHQPFRDVVLNLRRRANANADLAGKQSTAAGWMAYAARAIGLWEAADSIEQEADRAG